MNSLRILLVDDHLLFRKGLARLLDAQPDLEVVGEASYAAQTTKVVTTNPITGIAADHPLRRGLEVSAEARLLEQQLGDAAFCGDHQDKPGVLQMSCFCQAKGEAQ